MVVWTCKQQSRDVNPYEKPISTSQINQSVWLIELSYGNGGGNWRLKLYFAISGTHITPTVLI